MKGVTKEWALTMAFCLFTLLALGLGLTWVNIERVDMAYELKRMQTEIDAQEALISKLEVERNTLITPDRLRVLAGQYGLTQARPGQIRRLALTGEELPSPVIKAAPPAPEKPKAKQETGKAVKGAKDSKDSRESKDAKAAKAVKGTKEAKTSADSQEAKGGKDAASAQDRAARKTEAAQARESRPRDSEPAAEGASQVEIKHAKGARSGPDGIKEKPTGPTDPSVGKPQGDTKNNSKDRQPTPLG